MDTVTVRPVRLEDAAAFVRIYNHYVDHGHAIFDETYDTVAQRRTLLARYGDTGRYRCLVSQADGQVLGWASSNPYRSHPAFARTVELSVMLAPEARGRGIGSQLYGQLFNALREEDIHCLVAGIALPNPASIALHEKFGFEEVGVFREYAYKRATPVSSVWMQRLMG